MARTTETLQEAIKREVNISASYLGGELSEARTEAMERYLGEPYGNEIEGRSQVVSTDVSDTIESILPDFMEIFASGDRICAFEPQGAEDKRIAEQASDYVNYVWNVDNPGFEISYDWQKDALLQKNGFVKTYWNDSERVKEETLENVNSVMLAQLMDDPEVEVIEQEEKEVTPEFAKIAPDGILFDIKIRRTSKMGRVKIEVIPPEELGMSRYARSIYDTDCVWHKTEKSVSDLVQMGFDRDEIEKIPSDDEQIFNQERIARFSDEDAGPDVSESTDPSMRKIWLYEVYIRFDWDDDGIAEWRQVFCAGSSFTVLSNESIEDHCFDTITPIRMPHKAFGRSVADLVMDVALIKTTVQRQILDNAYQANNQRMLINEDVNLDDYLTNRPGNPIRVRGSTPVGAAAMPVPPAPLGQHMFQLLQYFDGVREARTGVTRYNQGLDANSLNDTASGINMILGRAQARMMLIARLFAETGYKRVMMRILKLLITHQDKPRVIRLRNKWVEMDPRTWNANMDVTINVGIGQGTQQAKQQTLMNILGIQKAAIQMQGGVEGPLVTMDKIFNTVDQLAKASGFRNGDMFFADPSTPEMQAMLQQQKANQQPPPEIVKVQLEDKREREKMMIEAQERMGRLEHDRERARRELAIKEFAAASEAEIERARLRLEEIEVQIAAAESGHRLRIEQHNALVQGETASLDNRIKVANTNKELLEAQPELISTALMETVQQLQQIAGPLTQAAQKLTGDKELIRDANGDVVAVRYADGTVQQVVRDPSGNMTGLETIQ
jgi:YD repeat-containing protein